MGNVNPCIKREPSGVPADDVTNYPNDNGHPYGNNVVEKIYEIRDII